MTIEIQATTYTVAIVARRLGVAAATLRTWDRRYGLGPSSHEAGAHRRYTLEDLARLESMRRMVNAGVPACDAAKLCATADIAQLPQIKLAPNEDISQVAVATATNLESGTAVAKGLLRAATSLDSLACHAIIARSLKQRGVVKTWNEVLTPVLVAVGEKWSATQKGIEVEHVLTDQVLATFMEYTNSITETKNAKTVLVVSAKKDLHSRPLYAAAAGLAEKRISSRNLGARIPHETLVSSMERIGPSAVLVWCQTPDLAQPVRLAGLPHLRPAAKIFAGGPGWQEALPNGVTHVKTLAEAVNLLAKASLD